MGRFPRTLGAVCGIVASVLPAAAPVPDLGPRLKLLARRGPNGAGATTIALPWATVALGQTRLAIVDRRPIALPYRFPAVGVSLAYNGEVYNWQQLRSELTNGIPWETRCDAEVVAHAWRAWGPAMCDRFNGMWGLVLVDELRGEVFAARDRAGEKPLAYAVHDGSLHFASELKALGVPLHPGAPLPSALALEFDDGDEEGRTAFRGIRQLPPGTAWHLKSPADLATGPTPWWTLPVCAEPRRPTRIQEEHDLLEEGVAVVREAVRCRAIAEVPVAILLSGGLDSAIVQAVARADRLYCVTFPETGDNLSGAQAAARGLPVHAVTFGPDQARAVLPRVAWHLDTPATWSALGLWHVAEAVAADGGVVVLSGEGADELFRGYSRYRLLWHLDQLTDDPVLALYGPLRRYLLGGTEELLVRLLCRSDLPDAKRWTAEAVRRFALGRSLVEDCARLDWHLTLPVLLRMADRMNMAHGIEGRCPFLDPAVIAWASALPDDLKIDARDTKAILRKVGAALGVSPALAFDPNKRGLAVPWPRWFPGQTGGRGAWDRRGFVSASERAWRQAFAAHGPAHTLTASPSP